MTTKTHVPLDGFPGAAELEDTSANDMFFVPAEAPPAERQWSKLDKSILLSAVLVFVIRYNSATFVGGFAYLLATSATMVGWIASAYTLGAAMSSLVTPTLVARYGTKHTVLAGMVFSVGFKLLFAFTPVLLHRLEEQQYVYMVVSLGKGGLGALAEVGCIVLLTNHFQEHIGKISAGLGILSSGSGETGRLLGSAMYQVGEDNFGCGGVVFCGLFLAALSALAIPFLLALLPHRSIEANGVSEEKGSYWQLMTWRRAVSLASLMLNVMLLCIMSVFGSFKLGRYGWGLSPLQISAVIGIGTITMLLFSVPVGWLADRFKHNECGLKTIQGVGFLLYALAYLIAGPAVLPGCHAFDHISWFMFATALKGVAAATLNACFNDLLLGVSKENPRDRARIAGLWNTAQMVGVVASGMVGPLQDTMGFAGLCTVVAVASITIGCVMLIVARGATQLAIADDLRPLAGPADEAALVEDNEPAYYTTPFDTKPS